MNILITGGPTNEPIDEVMKITNMSSGSTAVKLASALKARGAEIKLVLNNSVPCSLDDVKIIRVETTLDMLNALRQASKDQVEAVIHTAAVGDYRADFSFLMEDMADEIFRKIDTVKTPDDILKILTNPDCKLGSDTKISSYQENLTVKLALTEKIISHLRGWYQDSLIIGCKLLYDVSKEALYEAAHKLVIKNNVDYILANDLKDLELSDITRYLVDSNGWTGKRLKDIDAIADFVMEKLSMRGAR